MRSPPLSRPRFPRLIWLSALAAALLFLGVDSGLRLRALATLSSLRLDDAPALAPDPASPSGFRGGQHRLILPTAGTDGYHWILQTERVLAGEGLRIRETRVDNAPDGREVHWSSLPRWWLAGLTRTQQLLHPELTAPRALERVAPGAGAVALALFLLALTPLVARRMGALAAALLPVSWIAVFPLYETLMAGIVDHHGYLAMCVLGSLLLLVMGGGGWVGGEASPPERTALPLADPAGARRLFAAAGILGGIGLWINAVAMLPLLVGVGLGAVAAAAVGGPEAASDPTQPTTAPRVAPELWRLWGVAGGLTALAAYALEYAPGHMGMRLEVNHPLYALAWMGGADLVARLGRILQQGAPGEPDPGGRPEGGWPWMLADVLLLAGPGLAILATRGDAFLLSDSFLRALHLQYIREFQGLATHLDGQSWLSIFQSVSILPLVLLPAAALLLAWAQSIRYDRRWPGLVAAAAALPGVAFLHISVQAGAAAALESAFGMPAGAAEVVGHLVGVGADGAAAAAALFWARRTSRLVVHPGSVARLAGTAFPAALLLALALWQVRWLPTAAAALLALLLVLAPGRSAVGSDAPRRRRGAEAIFLLVLLLPLPLSTLLFPWRYGYPLAEEAPQLLARDVAHRLRARSGPEEIVVAGPPVTTTRMVWFGGFRGLGTLYWENAEGLGAMAEILAAQEESELREALVRRGVTHLVIPSWEPLPNLDPSREGPGDGGDGLDRAREPGFLERALRSSSLPPWLPPLEDLGVRALGDLEVRVFRVLPPAAEAGPA